MKKTVKVWGWLKSRLLDVGRLLAEITLFVFSTPFFIAFALIGVLYTFFKHLIKRDYSLTKQLRPIVRSATLITDAFANASAGELLNDLNGIKPTEKIRYSKWYQTISEVAGLRFMFYNDSKFRNILDKFLGENHCTDAIREENKFYYYYKK